MNYIGNCLPFIFRRSKSISILVQALLQRQVTDLTNAQSYVEALMMKGKDKGQAQVVAERIKEEFKDENITIEDGSDGNVVIIGNTSPYRRIMGLEADKAFISLPMSRTTVGIDFVVYLPAELERREGEIVAWLNGIVFAGVGFEIKYV